MDKCSLPRVRTIVRQLEGGNLQSFSSEDLYELLKELRTVYICNVPILDNRNTWYRGRRCENGQVFNHLDDLKYRKDCNSMGRAHVVGNPVYYASRNRDTAATEVGVQAKETFQIICARVKPGITCKAVLIGEADYVYKSGLSLIGDQKSIQNVWDNINKFSEEDTIAWLLVDAFFAKQFSAPISRTPHIGYKLTSAISMMLYGVGGAIMYPSVDHRGGLNIAIPAHIFDEKFEVTETEVFEIPECHGYEYYSFKTVKGTKNFSSDGHILGG